MGVMSCAIITILLLIPLSLLNNVHLSNCYSGLFSPLFQLGLHIFSYGSEIFFVMLHLCYFSAGPTGLHKRDNPYIIVINSLSFFLSRSLSASIPLFSFILSVPLIGFGLWQVIGALLFPLVIVKVPINLLILKSGSQTIAKFDLIERNKKYNQS